MICIATNVDTVSKGTVTFVIGDYIFVFDKHLHYSEAPTGIEIICLIVSNAHKCSLDKEFSR